MPSLGASRDGAVVYTASPIEPTTEEVVEAETEEAETAEPAVEMPQPYTILAKMSESSIGVLKAANVDINAIVTGAGEALIARIKEGKING